MEKWDIYKERAFIENLLCQRFNFFILSFALIVTASATVNTTTLYNIILTSGIIICTLLFFTIYRIYTKLDIALKYIYENDKDSIFHEIQKRTHEYPLNFKNMNRLIGVFIPIACVLTLVILLCCGNNYTAHIQQHSPIFQNQ
ncbi:MAG TPA: hypothetical protein H9962_08080 [Candidatus Mailhella merdigallinarum]|uniref:Uncharacterized protein n=1 Tax=Candidatus Mailhella merdigallinarum TaxID=2838658 RepID=A0A9D2HEP6_9BACT|nr:hypothetical protein [Candidatus Mailhella merdigallinarum]